EAVIYTGLSLMHSQEDDDDDIDDEEDDIDEEEDDMEHATEKTVKDVFETLTEEQKNVVYFMIGSAIEEANKSKSGGSAKQSAIEYSNEGDLNHQEGTFDMTRNVFEQTGFAKNDGPSLTHSQLTAIVEDAKKIGSFKESLLAHADEYGITDIDLLFPDAKNVTSQPDLVARRTEWVKAII